MWADVVCPWCYLGEARLRAAITAYRARPDSHPVTVRHRAYELDPTLPAGVHRSVVEHLAAAYGGGVEGARAMIDRVTQVAAADGLVLDFDRAVRCSSFDGHRLLAAAREHGGEQLEGALVRRLYAAHLTEGLVIDDPDVLEQLGLEAGLPSPVSREVLGGDAYADRVRADEALARDLGVTGVPFAVAGGRLAVSGAQPVAVFVQLIEQAVAAG